MGEMASHTLELLRAIRSDITEIKAELKEVRERLDAHDRRFEVLESQFTTMQGQFGVMQSQFASLQSQVASLASQVASLTGSMIRGFDRLTSAIEAQSELATERHLDVERRLSDLDNRLARVEARQP